MIDIPPFLSHLKVTDKGYPVPYFAAYVDGKPDLRLMDPMKWASCRKHDLCQICGRKFQGRARYWITGPEGLRNGAHSDPPMHFECAVFSMAACPHLQIEKTRRRDVDPAIGGPDEERGQILEKAEVLFLIRAPRNRVSTLEKQRVFRFKPELVWKLEYIDGKLDVSAVNKKGK